MMRRGAFGLLGSAVAMLAGCGMFNSSASFHYQMQVEGDHPGSAVYEIFAEKNNDIVKLPDERSGGSIIRGEALVIETPSGPVFVLLKSAIDGKELKGAIMRALAPNVPLSEEPYSYAVTNQLADSNDGDFKGELPSKDWPMMVRFRDITDPRSLELVNPASIGVNRITLETTDDNVTTGIKERLAWLGDRGHVVSGSTINPTLNETIYHEVFWQGYEK